jgi:DNA-binding GntR family transcriptional regulator
MSEARTKKRDDEAPEEFGVPRLARETLNDRVYVELKRSIMSGALMPGTNVSIRGLARSVGVSLMPVREALRRLSAERALEMLPNRSFTIPMPTIEAFTEILKLRVTLEGMATEAAAEHVTPLEIKRLETLQGKLGNPGNMKVAAYLELNQQFHFIIYGASRMTVIMPMIESLWLQIGPLLNLVISNRRFQKCTDYHTGAIHALGQRDGPAARAAIEGDIVDAADVILEWLRTPKERSRVRRQAKEASVR